MTLSTTAKLKRFYNRFSSEHQVLVLINADPDAIASAMAVKRLLWKKVAGVAISNVNIIRRPDNLAMIRLLGIPLIHIDDIDASRYHRVVMVDSQPDHHETLSRFTVDIVIDHHPDTSPASIPYKDIRPKYGAVATIMTEYLRAARIKPSVKLATGLFHAIKTDTGNFQRQTAIEDVRAFQFLFHHTNIHLARRIEQAEVRLDFLKYYKKALQVMRRRRGRIFVHLGPVVHPDICVLIADFFMKVDSINWSIVSGVCEKRLTIIFRNDGIRKNAGNTAKTGFGHIGSAGGHKSMARAEIATDELRAVVRPSDEALVSRWIIKRVEKKGAPS
jgi:nanoRNase/pAp phosphatase (c-di-AMP/oligoRNAs hydrolase)